VLPRVDTGIKLQFSPTFERLQGAAESQSMKRQQQAFAASEQGREWARKRESLPVFQVRDQLLEALTSGHMAVLSGDTGCGKTTQVPQYLLEHEIAQGRGATCSIICTQPRRIAAMSVADRVAQERAEPPPGKRGSRVGCAQFLNL
jgi:HrpA-like RNA helicase